MLLWPNGWLIHVNCFRPMEYGQFDLCHIQTGVLNVLVWCGLLLLPFTMRTACHREGLFCLPSARRCGEHRQSSGAQAELSRAAAGSRTHEQEIRFVIRSFSYCSQGILIQDFTYPSSSIVFVLSIPDMSLKCSCVDEFKDQVSNSSSIFLLLKCFSK